MSGSDAAAPVAARYVDWAWSPAHEPPADVRAAAARQLLDALGCAVAGARSGEVGFVSEVADALGGPAEAQRLDGRPDSSAPVAALVNGALLHALDTDDTHAASLVHVSAAVVPATLAVAQQTGASGGRLLDAIVIGNEVVTRLGSAIPHAFHARGFHATSVCGVFASALSAAWLMDLAPPAATAALGIAGSQAAGSLEFLASPASTKQLHPGFAAQAAVLSARLAAAGATGPETVIEGERGGLFRAYADRAIDADLLVDGLGDRWETLRLVTKCYPCCHLSHASIDAAAALVASGVDVADIESIEVLIHPDADDIVATPAAAKAHPTTPYGAKFSLPWCVAEQLLAGSVTLASFAPERIERADVLDLAGRVRCRVSADDGGVPAAALGGEIQATLRNGTTVAAVAPGGRGGPDLAMTDDERVARFVDQCGAPAAEGVAPQILAIAEADAVEIRDVVSTLAAFVARSSGGSCV